jgi:hypothetical protein
MNKQRSLICRLKGGLGNQLFQYACAFKAAKQLDAALSFDASILTPGDAIGRQLELKKIFDEKFSENSVQPDMPIVTAENPARLLDDVEKLFSSGNSAVVLDGYFQEEGFFSETSSEIKADLVIFRTRYLSGRTLSKQRTNTVGLHLRRHDYQHLGLCADNYYLEAVKWFVSKFGGDVQFFVFTDEPLFTSDLFKTLAGNALISVVSTRDHLADFLLLSLCDHFVIANSSYSWWAAYLGETSESIVFSPYSPWIVGSEMDPAPRRWCKVAGIVARDQHPTDLKEKVRWARFESSYYRYESTVLVLKDETIMHADPKQLFPCMDDEVVNHPIEPHYLYHPAWAIRKLLEYGIKEHYDFGSTLVFATMASSISNVTLHDFRPPRIFLPGLACKACDLMKLEYETNSLPSISCMHTIEHIGLGRYGDSLNPLGDRIAASELVRILKPGGLLFFVVPVGRPRLQFNAHRIYSFDMVLEMLKPLVLIEHSLIPDDAVNVGMKDNPSPEFILQQNHGCGCFVFKKPA